MGAASDGSAPAALRTPTEHEGVVVRTQEPRQRRPNLTLPLPQRRRVLKKSAEPTGPSASVTQALPPPFSTRLHIAAEVPRPVSLALFDVFGSAWRRGSLGGQREQQGRS